MVKYAPQSSEFNAVVKIDKYYSVLLYISIVISLLPTLEYKWEWVTLDNNIMVFLNIVIILLLFAIKLYRDYRLNKAENIRRDSLLDNAFNTNIGEEIPIEYYDNEEINYGYNKLLANICQNSMFSLKTSDIMFRRLILPIAVLFAVIIWCFVIGFANLKFATFLLQTLLSAIFLVRIIEIGFYKHNAYCIYEKAKSLLNETSPGNDHFIVAVLQLLVKYETNISRFQIILDEKTYQELNRDQTQKWEEIKSRYINKTA